MKKKPTAKSSQWTEVTREEVESFLNKAARKGKGLKVPSYTEDGELTEIKKVSKKDYVRKWGKITLVGPPIEVSRDESDIWIRRPYEDESEVILAVSAADRRQWKIKPKDSSVIKKRYRNTTAEQPHRGPKVQPKPKAYDEFGRTVKDKVHGVYTPSIIGEKMKIRHKPKSGRKAKPVVIETGKLIFKERRYKGQLIRKLVGREKVTA